MLQIALYIPIALVICLVLSVLREDAPGATVRAAVKNFLLLTVVLAAGTAAIFAIEWLF